MTAPIGHAGAITTVSHPVLGTLELVAISPERSYPLRQQVLRPHEPVAAMRAIDSGDPAELVVGALTGTGEVVATGAIAPAAPPADLAADLAPDLAADLAPDLAADLGADLAPDVGAAVAWRLRGMAARPDVRGAGAGTAVLDALMAHAQRHGARIVWCSARVPAQRLYERAGFQVFGDVWDAPKIGPHVIMWCRLGAAHGR